MIWWMAKTGLFPWEKSPAEKKCHHDLGLDVNLYLLVGFDNKNLDFTISPDLLYEDFEHGGIVMLGSSLNWDTPIYGHQDIFLI